jgi:DNA-binding response OmpR family regulator
VKRILIIEDDPVIAEVEKDYLKMNGFEVEMALTGDAGLRLALEENFDLLVLDLMLPHTDGFDICRQVRGAKNIPILIVSAKKEDVDKIRGFGLGADDYVIKPFSLSELAARVKAHLDRYDRLTGKPEGMEVIRVGGITIERLSRRVFVNGSEQPLTSKEYDLLLFLVTNPNRVFTKDHLFDRVWGLDSIGDNATVTVHISKLREKIEAEPAKPQYIETIWGVGYRFNV